MLGVDRGASLKDIKAAYYKVFNGMRGLIPWK